MFGLFKKKTVKKTVAPNAVYMSREMADRALVQTAAAADRPVMVTSFFRDSLTRIGFALDSEGLPARPVEYFNEIRDLSESAPLLLNARRALDDSGFESGLRAADTEFLFLFVERYPLFSVAERFLDIVERVAESRMQRVIFFTGMDEPFIAAFGGDRLVQMMQSMGMDPTERISHPMVDKSIENACRKIEKRVPRPIPADSDSAWFAMNLVGR